MKNLFAAALLIMNLAAPPGHAADNMKAFPPAAAGMVRHVLQLPPAVGESALKVELIVGKTVELEARNKYFFAGRIEAEAIQGWGFTRYKVEQLGPMAGTLMAVDPDAPKVARFVKLGGEPYLIRYNSRLPVVVYVPEGAEVHYRIWRASPETTALERG